MLPYRVKHKKLGEGTVVKIDEKYAIVQFPKDKKTFRLQGFDNYFEIYDAEFQNIVNTANSAVIQNTKEIGSDIREKTVQSRIHQTVEVSSSNALLGPRSQTIYVPDLRQMFEIVGYIARPGRVSSFEAEVPMDGRDDLFQRMFPGQTYRPITMGNTPSGLPNKLSPQFRINFVSLRNCPQILASNMGQGNGSCVGRINKSGFVLTLVQNYGFRFGDYQDIDKIRSIASERGYLEDFERGFLL